MFSTGQSKPSIVEHVDSDYADDVVNRRSITRYAFTLALWPICWRSYTQPIVTMSITKAEYMEVAEAAK